MQILIDGKEVDTLAGHVDLRHPLQKNLKWSGRRRAIHDTQRWTNVGGPERRRASRPDFIMHAEGSVLIEVGRTRVICTASVEDRVPPFLRNTGKGWVTAEYGMLPRATSTRTQREATAGKVGGRTQEIQRLIGRSLRSVTPPRRARRADDLGRLRRHPGRRRHAHRVDHRRLRRAGARAAADEARRDRSRRCPSSTTSPRPASASSAALPMLDLAYEEDSRADVDMNIVKTGDGRFIEVQGTAEGAPFERQALDDSAGARRQGHPGARRRSSGRSSAA